MQSEWNCDEIGLLAIHGFSLFEDRLACGVVRDNLWGAWVWYHTPGKRF